MTPRLGSIRALHCACTGECKNKLDKTKLVCSHVLVLNSRFLTLFLPSLAFVLPSRSLSLSLSSPPGQSRRQMCRWMAPFFLFLLDGARSVNCTQNTHFLNSVFVPLLRIRAARPPSHFSLRQTATCRSHGGNLKSHLRSSAGWELWNQSKVSNAISNRLDLIGTYFKPQLVPDVLAVPAQPFL